MRGVCNDAAPAHSTGYTVSSRPAVESSSVAPAGGARSGSLEVCAAGPPRVSGESLVFLAISHVLDDRRRLGGVLLLCRTRGAEAGASIAAASAGAFYDVLRGWDAGFFSFD